MEKHALKKEYASERTIATRPTARVILEEYVSQHRKEVADQYGREPLLVTPTGTRQPHQTTLGGYMYNLTRPCLHSDCPHDRNRDECDAMRRNSRACKCPSSESTERLRRSSRAAGRGDAREERNGFTAGKPAPAIEPRSPASIVAVTDHRRSSSVPARASSGVGPRLPVVASEWIDHERDREPVVALRRSSRDGERLADEHGDDAGERALSAPDRLDHPVTPSSPGTQRTTSEAANSPPSTRESFRPVHSAATITTETTVSQAMVSSAPPPTARGRRTAARPRTPSTSRRCSRRRCRPRPRSCRCAGPPARPQTPAWRCPPRRWCRRSPAPRCRRRGPGWWPRRPGGPR